MASRWQRNPTCSRQGNAVCACACVLSGVLALLQSVSLAAPGCMRQRIVQNTLQVCDLLTAVVLTVVSPALLRGLSHQQEMIRPPTWAAMFDSVTGAKG